MGDNTAVVFLRDGTVLTWEPVESVVTQHGVMTIHWHPEAHTDRVEMIPIDLVKHLSLGPRVSPPA